MKAGWMRMLGERVLAENHGIALAIWFNLGLLAIALAAMPFDRRRILGLNPWVKPMKFDLSVLIYAVTIAVLLWLLPGWRQSRWWIGWGIGLAMMVENAIITLQSMRGVRSHMNYTSWFNGIAFATMGVFIALNTVLVAWLLVLYLRDQSALPRAVVWGIRLGLLSLLAGSIEGVLMVGRFNGHTIGAADGGVGLPFVNWSTGHGDLRVAHFFALHALQTFPLVGWGLSRLPIGMWTQCVGTVLFALAYEAGVWVLFAQALAGRPVWGG